MEARGVGNRIDFDDLHQWLQRLLRLGHMLRQESRRIGRAPLRRGAWREASCFNDAERAALALAEAVTRLSDRTDAVPDEIWGETARHYDEPALAALILSIATKYARMPESTM